MSGGRCRRTGDASVLRRRGSAIRADAGCRDARRRGRGHGSCPGLRRPCRRRVSICRRGLRYGVRRMPSRSRRVRKWLTTMLRPSSGKWVAPRYGADDGTLLSGCLPRQSMRAAEGSKQSAAPRLRRLRTVPARVAGVMRAILGDPRRRSPYSQAKVDVRTGRHARQRPVRRDSESISRRNPCDRHDKIVSASSDLGRFRKSGHIALATLEFA